MGLAKTEDFTVKHNRIAVYSKALAHPARIAILNLLIEKQDCICGAIVDEIPLSQSTVSQHLKELKNAGLIKGIIEGNSICYCVNEKALQKMQNYFTRLSSMLDNKNSKCC